MWFPSPLEDSGPKGPDRVTERLPLTLERVDKGLNQHVLLEFGIDVMGREDLRGTQRETSWGLSKLISEHLQEKVLTVMAFACGDTKAVSDLGPGCSR